MLPHFLVCDTSWQPDLQLSLLANRTLPHSGTGYGSRTWWIVLLLTNVWCTFILRLTCRFGCPPRRLGAACGTSEQTLKESPDLPTLYTSLNFLHSHLTISKVCPDHIPWTKLQDGRFREEDPEDITRLYCKLPSIGSLIPWNSTFLMKHNAFRDSLPMKLYIFTYVLFYIQIIIF